MPIISHREWTFEDPLVVVGFPSQGLVGAIVASHAVPHLEMELVASMDHPGFPPIASVRDGAALSPVQFFASTLRCGLDSECSQLVVIRSDAKPSPEQSDEIAQEILTWAAEIGAERVVSLEGAQTGGESEDVFAVPNLCCQVDFERLGARPFPDGAMSGLSASLLTEGNANQMGVITLFTGVAEDRADAAAAARLVEVVDLLVPGVKMEPGPLAEKAQEHETKLRASLEEQERATDGSKMMYG